MKIKLGSTFNRLTVIGESCIPRHAMFRCSCGTIKSILEYQVSSGITKSCGCWRKEVSGAKNRTHKLSNSQTYRIWAGMKARCSNPKSDQGNLYLARGITVCDRWNNSFEAFFSDMGERPKGKTIDRIDSNLGYSKDNCRWATMKEQARNTRRNKYITANGETLIVAEWAERLGCAHRTIPNRIAMGWSEEDAVTIRINGRRSSKVKK